MNEACYELLSHMIGRIMENAEEALNEHRDNPGDSFKSGRNLAYYEVIDMIKNDLIVYDVDLAKAGADYNPDKFVC